MAVLHPQNQVWGGGGGGAETPPHITAPPPTHLLTPPPLPKIGARPRNGSLLLYNRKKVKYRKDGYCWKKRRDGKTTREDHMKLKVQGVEVRGGGTPSDPPSNDPPTPPQNPPRPQLGGGKKPPPPPFNL